ncbi:trehalose transport-related protein [Auriculariales sp. MPI-PUGE-AT-0066]|nr:trehalose transport-related protein [Auriculariales sp. MPI-PUGE-AT-0066]
MAANLRHAGTDVVVADNENLAKELDANIIRDAADADANEHKMSLPEAFRIHKKAIFWSMALSAALIMEGYDVVIIGAFNGHPAFKRRFGRVNPAAPDGFEIPAEWQSALGNGSSAGGILGLLVNGWAADKYGPKIVLLISIVSLTAFIFITVFAKSLTMLVIGEVLCGIPWGVFQTLTTAYASEVCPIQLRGYLAAYVNMCWGIGIVISSVIADASIRLLPETSDWSWRMPFIVQWVWVIPLFLIFLFCPTSPWWLVRQGRLEDAAKQIRRLTSEKYYSEEQIKHQVAMMVHTNALEIQNAAGTSYFDCFRGIDRRRTEISMMVFASQLLSGQNLIGQGVQFLQRAGLATRMAFKLNMVLNSMFCIGTIASWGLMYFFGRRTLYTSGMLAMCITVWVIGGLGYAEQTTGVSRGMGGLLIALNFVYNSTLGPICYTLIAEVSSTRLRAKTVALSRIAYQIVNIICGIITPRMLTVSSWNWGAKSGIFWGVISFLTLIYLLLRLPETRGRSYGELDLLFEHRIPAWRFKSTKVDQFAVRSKSTDLDDKEDIKHVD